MTRKILLVEDDRKIVKELSDFLGREGFATVSVDGEEKALGRLSSETFDLVLVDIQLREGNGFSLCGKLKQQYHLPVIFLTASGDEQSTVGGFDLGADDYIAKPFRPHELVSRINNALRKYHPEGRIVSVGNVAVDTDAGVVRKAGEIVELSALEYRLFMILLENRGRIMTREMLLSKIWDIAGDFVNDNTLTVYIKRLRKKLEDDPADPSVIRTVRGIGYRIDA